MRTNLFTVFAATSALALAACSPADEDEAVEETTAEAEPTDVAEETAGVANANDATLEMLSGMEGIDAELADAIVAGQPYASITDLNAVLMASMTEEEAAAVREVLFVPVNLNTATNEELALIPGIDDRMIHEFEEYRPYADMETFDREIGKYIDADEVARFRQYVTL